MKQNLFMSRRNHLCVSVTLLFHQRMPDDEFVDACEKNSSLTLALSDFAIFALSL